jgi:hypothetical protein
MSLRLKKDIKMSKLLTTLAADAINPKNEIKNNATTTGNGDEFDNSITVIINSIIAVLGILAVVVIIIGGVSYMTSNGDASKVKKAKDTILYGVIGLIIVILSAAIVNFVIAKVTQ